MLALWLLPSSPAREAFRALIGDLAGRFDAPPFEPHLTLLGVPFQDSVHFAQLEELLLAPSIELEIEGIEFSEKYTKTLFVQFKQQPKLIELQNAVLRSLGIEEEQELNPHLSLIYRTMPNERKAELARSIRLPFARVRFAAMRAVVTPATIESREGVESWRTIWEKQLS